MKALLDGQDFSDRFAIRDYPVDTGLRAGQVGEVQFVVVPALDTPPGIYTLYPIITSHIDAVDEKPIRHRLPGRVSGEDTVPTVGIRVKVL